MAKPEAIEWLENQTGQKIDYQAGPETHEADRHLSVRLPSSLFVELERVAQRNGLSVSKLVRELIVGATNSNEPGPTEVLVRRIESDARELRRRITS